MQRMNRRDFLKAAGFSGVGLALAACAAPGAAPAADTSGASPASEPVVITLVESWFGVPQFRESIEPVTQAISEKMQREGLNIELRSLLLDQHQEKYPALYAAGSDFTMAFDAPWYQMSTLRNQGALAPLEDLIEEHGPQLKEAITDTIYNANFMNGHLYGIPAAYYYGQTGGVMFREDLRQKYGAEMPTSEEGWTSLESFLQAVLDNEPDMIPFVNIATQSMIGYTRGRKGWSPAGLDGTGVTIPNIEEGFVFVDEEDDPAIVENAQILRSWWEKGYINKTDMPTSGTSQNSQIDYIYPGHAASCVENEPDYKWVDQTKQMKASFPDASLFGVDMTGQSAGVKGLGVLKQFNFIVFNVNAPEEQIVAGIQFFNWLASSQDNLDLWLMGIEGENYIKEDNMRFSEVEGIDATRNYRRQWYVSGMSGRYQRLPADLPKEAEETIAFLTNADNFIFNPHEGFEPDTKALELDMAKLNAVYLEAVHGLASGQLPTDEARAMMKDTLDSAGRQEYKEKLQAQLDAYIEANPQ